MKLPFWPNPQGYRDVKLGLVRIYDLLARLDNPQQKLPPTIHLAGTNGKGSTLTFLRTIFEEAGYSVHAYTSPHLVLFNERIVLNGKNISDNFLNKCLQDCKDAALQYPKIDVTFFEGITVAAFLAFSKVSADILLLETGMGGRLDATNVITKNLLSIITPIALDHTEFLGKTLAKIAYEKAGIIKKECPVIIGKQRVAALRTIKKYATKLNCKIYDGTLAGAKFCTPTLQGSHQLENASVAITAALIQKKFTITTEHINSALKKASWPARLQKITSGKFYKKLPNNFELILDGSHNPQGAITLRNFLKHHKAKRIILVFAMLKDKNCNDFLNKIKNEIDELIALEIAGESKSYNKNKIIKIAQNLKIKSQIAKDFDDVFAKILKIDNGEESLIILSGSLYQAGNFLEQNNI